MLIRHSHSGLVLRVAVLVMGLAISQAGYGQGQARSRDRSSGNSVQWANAWVPSRIGGPIDVLLLAPSAHRNFAETLQSSGDLQFHFPADGEESVSLDLLDDVDVVLWAHSEGEPGERIQALLREARRRDLGVAAVVFGSDNDFFIENLSSGMATLDIADDVLSGVGGLLPRRLDAGLADVKFFEKDAFRFVTVGHPGPAPLRQFVTPPAEELFLGRLEAYENGIFLLLKAIEWAAYREPPIRIVALEPEKLPEPSPIDTPPQIPIEFVHRLKEMVPIPAILPVMLRLNKPADRRYGVQVRVRYPGRDLRWEFLAQESIERGMRAVVLDVPVGRGEAWLDIRMLKGQDVVDVHTIGLPARGWPRIRNLQISKQVVRTNDTIHVSATIDPRLDPPRPASLYCEVLDPNNRVIARALQSVDENGGDASVRIVLTDVEASLLMLNVYVVEGRGIQIISGRDREDAAFAQQSIWVQHDDPAGFTLALESSGALEPPLEETLGAASARGIDTILMRDQPGVSGVGPASAGLQVIPTYAPSARNAHGDTEDFLDSHGSSSGIFRREERLSIQEEISDQSGEYADALPARYRDVRALNASWGTAFHAWPDLQGWPALSEWPISPALDFAEYIVEQRSAERERLRNSAAGRLGASTILVDLDSSEQTNRLAQLFSAQSRRIVLTAEDNTLASLLANEAGSPGRWWMRQGGDDWGRLTWHAVALGAQGLVWPEGTIDTLTIPPPRKRDAETWNRNWDSVLRVSQEVAPLVAAADAVRSPIGVYSNRGSALLDSVGDEGNKHTDAVLRAVDVLERLGYAPQWLAGAAVLAERMDSLRVVVLPYLPILDHEERKLLSAFRARGGVIIADVLPGDYDADGQHALQESVAELFGVRFSEPGVIPNEALQPLDPEPEAVDSAGDLLFAVSVSRHTGLVPREARAEAALDGGGGWFVQRDISGGTWLLNHPLTGPDIDSQLENRLADFLKRAAILPLFPDIGSGITRRRYRSGAATIDIAVAAQDSDKSDRTIKREVDDGRTLYFPLEHRAVQGGNTATIRIPEGAGTLWTELPYEVTRLVVEHPSKIQRGIRFSAEVTVKTRGDLPGRHPVRIALFPKSNMNNPILAETIVCEEGRGSAHFRPVLSEAPGQYVLQVWDLLSGVVYRSPIELEAN